MEITLPEAELDAILAHPLVRGLLECGSDGAVVIDARTREVVAMNQRAQELLGRSEAESVGCRCHETLASPVCQQACPLTRAEAGQPPADRVALYYRSQDAEVVHANARMLIVRSPSGEPIAGIELFQDQREVRALERALRSRRSLHGLVGRSEVMQHLYDRVEEIAPCDTPVLVTGEQGVGKRRLAEALHSASPRAEAALVVLPVDGIPATRAAELLAEALQQAQGGTLLLCGVDRAAAELGPSLDDLVAAGHAVLRGHPLRLDRARLVVTARDPDGLPASLRGRLSDVTLGVPPLRERVEDLPLLADALLRDAPGRPGPSGAWSEGVLAALARHPWPGNVAELAACLRAALLRAEGGPLRVEHLQLVPTEPLETLADLEAHAIARAMAAADGNLSAAARLLGIDRSTLWRKLKRADPAMPGRDPGGQSPQ